MRLFEWLKRAPAGGTGEWKKAWEAAVAAPDPAQIQALRASLDALALPPDDIEVEVEMLDGLTALCELKSSMAGGSLPIVQTGHRVAAGATCHFTSPASAPDHPAQPAGRVILTSERAIFAGGGSAQQVPWHAVAQVLRSERDLLLVARGGEAAYRFRFNSFADALCAAALAGHLAGRRTAGAAAL